MKLWFVGLIVLAIIVVALWRRWRSKRTTGVTRLILFCQRMGLNQDPVQDVFIRAQEALVRSDDLILQRAEFDCNGELARKYGIKESSLPALVCQHLSRGKPGKRVPICTRVILARPGLDLPGLTDIITRFAASRIDA